MTALFFCCRFYLRIRSPNACVMVLSYTFAFCLTAKLAEFQIQVCFQHTVDGSACIPHTVGWQVTPCDPIYHASSRSGVAG